MEFCTAIDISEGRGRTIAPKLALIRFIFAYVVDLPAMWGEEERT